MFFRKKQTDKLIFIKLILYDKKVFWTWECLLKIRKIIAINSRLTQFLVDPKPKHTHDLYT